MVLDTWAARNASGLLARAGRLGRWPWGGRRGRSSCWLAPARPGRRLREVCRQHALCQQPNPGCHNGRAAQRVHVRAGGGNTPRGCVVAEHCGLQRDHRGTGHCARASERSWRERGNERQGAAARDRHASGSGTTDSATCAGPFCERAGCRPRQWRAPFERDPVVTNATEPARSAGAALESYEERSAAVDAGTVHAARRTASCHAGIRALPT